MAACLYEGLCGKRAFPGDDAVSVAESIQSGPPAPIASFLGLESSVDAVLLRGMAQRPGDRFTSCSALGNALSEALGQSELQARLPDQSTLLKHAKQERRTQLGFGVLFLLLGATAATLLSQLSSTEPGQETESLEGQSPSWGPRPAFLSPLPGTQK